MVSQFDPQHDFTVDRQDYPVGDTVKGQLIQSIKSLPTADRDVQWIESDGVGLTVSSTVVDLPLQDVGSYDSVYITVEAAAIRYFMSGRLPTATVGHAATIGDQIILENRGEVANFRAIRRDSTDATLQISYGRRIYA